MPDPDKVKDACEACFDANKSDCSGFARAVGARIGVPLSGLANDIVDTISGGNGWVPLADGVEAAQAAEDGKFVVGGLKGSDQATPDLHGHVVVVVAGPLAHGAYPSAYWGRLDSVGRKDTTINWAWNTADRDNVFYAEHAI